MLRWILTGVVAVLAAFFWIMTVSVPMVSAAAPALIAIFLSVVVYFVWPKRRTTN